MLRPSTLIALSVAMAASFVSYAVRAQSRTVPLLLEQDTTLRVGQIAVLSIPSDHRYDQYANSKARIDGAWNGVLNLVSHSKRKVTFRASQTGTGVILLSPAYGLPEDPNCVSCATLHYFVRVIPANGGPQANFR